MSRHKILSIKERGGLQAYLQQEGFDAALVIRMLQNPQLNNSSIAAALNVTYPRLNKPVHRSRVRHWRAILAAENIAATD